MQPSRINLFNHILMVLLACVAVDCAAAPRSTSKPASVVAQARGQVARGQLNDAEKNLWTVLSTDPNQPDALTLLGIIRGRQKRYAEAEALFRHVLEIDVNSLVARRNLANVLVAQDKQAAAIEQYAKLVELAPRDDGAKIELAQLYVATGEFQSAVATLDRIPKGQLPRDAIPVEAASLLGVGRREEAAALIASVRGSASIEAELAEVFLDANAPELAMKAIDEAFSHSPHPSARLYYLKGRALQGEGHIDGAFESFNKALARDPKSVQVVVTMAALLASQNKHQESLALLKRAYALQPNSTDVLRPLVVESVRAGQPKTAARVAHALVQASPENLDDLYLAAAAMLEGEDYASASPIFERYVNQRPGDAKGFLGLGIVDLAQQHYPEARKALERALEIDPTNADAEYQLGELADRQGSSPEAMQHFDRAIEVQPNHAKALAKLGEMYLQAGQLPKAQDVLQRAVAADPNNPKAQYDLALALAKSGRTQEAKQHMDRSRALQAAEDAGKSPPPETR